MYTCLPGCSSLTLCGQGILDRYTQVNPKFIFIESEVFYAGKTLDLRDKAKEVIQSLKKTGLTLGILLPSGLSGKSQNIPDRSVLSFFLL